MDVKQHDGGVAQMPSKHETLSSNPHTSTHTKKKKQYDLFNLINMSGKKLIKHFQRIKVIQYFKI
jgi:hypothetical protein